MAVADAMWTVLDTSVLLQGGSPPAGPAATTPEVMAEVSPGGRDARRLAYWEAAGLEVRAASPASLARVEAAAEAAGSRPRLSRADVSVLALALDLVGTVWTDDNTMLDVALRLSLPARAIREGGIQGTVDWAPRCSGCGRWEGDVGTLCRVCGSEVLLRRRK